MIDDFYIEKIFKICKLVLHSVWMILIFPNTVYYRYFLYNMKEPFLDFIITVHIEKLFGKYTGTSPGSVAIVRFKK